MMTIVTEQPPCHIQTRQASDLLSAHLLPLRANQRADILDTTRHIYLCVCMCVCVCERERERERGTVVRGRVRESVCVCMCVCEREREREREGQL